MKYLKMLGLAAVAAMAFMAIAGAGSASATTLCETTANPCPTAWKLNVGETLDSSVEDTAKLSSFGITIDTCSEGTVKGTISNEGGATTTVSGTISSLTWGSCSVTTVSTETGGNFGSLEVHHIAGTDNGTVTSTGSSVTVNFAGSDCEFGTNNTDIGTLTGGNPATFDINGTIPEISGRSGCPASGGWSGHYKVTEPSGTLHVDAG